MMIQNKKAAIILAAGYGTRMKSSVPKVLHKIAGKPMIEYLIDSCQNAGIDKIITIISDNMDAVKDAVSPHETAIQQNPQGTGHAAKFAKEKLANFEGSVFILNGDGPLITSQTLNDLHNTSLDTGFSILGCKWENPFGYGRLITDGNYVSAIVEEQDCDDSQKKITLGNTGVYCTPSSQIFHWLNQLSNNNAQNEYYLTDIVEIASQNNIQCAYTTADENEVMGINSRAQLANAEQIMQDQLRQKAMDNGVTMIDPQTVTLSFDTAIEQDVIIEPHVVIGPGVRIKSGTRIQSFSHIEGTHIGEHSSIGPFARLRPQSKIGNNVTIGNFIEVNRSEFKEGAKSKHVSYIGDATIGEKANIGAGTVFANYDGFHKNNADIGANSFIGSNTTIVSPVTIGEGAIIAAGSTITTNVDSDALAVAREKEIIRAGWASKYREKNKKA